MKTNKLLLTFILGMFLVSFAYAGGLEAIEDGKGDIKIDEKIQPIDSYCLVQDGKAMIEKCSELPVEEKGEAIEVKLEEQKLLVKQDGLYLKDEVTNLEAKIEEKESSSVYIHKWDSKKQAWHVDNLNLEPVSVYLDLPYNSQPYKIMHYDKDDNYVTTFYRGQYEWLPNCVGEECQDNSGIARVYATISAESIGSDIFSIGNASSGWITQGQYAGVFDGVDDYVESQNITVSLPMEMNKTICAWVTITNNTSNNGIFGYISGSSGHQALTISTTGKLQQELQGNVTNSGRYSSASTLEQNTWYFVCSVINNADDLIQKVNGDVNLYINGVNQTISFLTTATSNSNPTYYRIGRSGGSSAYFNGSIKSVIIYNRSLSSAEVLAEYNKFTLNGINNSPVRNSAPNTTGLVAYYPFDDGSVADFSGNNNHGTNFGVLFSPVKYQTITLTSPANYNLTSSGLFTVAQSRWYEMMNLSWTYINSYSSDYNIAEDAQIALGEFGSWFEIIAILGIVGIVLLLLGDFGVQKDKNNY